MKKNRHNFGTENLLVISIKIGLASRLSTSPVVFLCVLKKLAK